MIFTFAYSPGPRDEKGRIAGFAVSARPAKYGTTGTASYFGDSSNLVRMTDKDRPATDQDPLLAP